MTDEKFSELVNLYLDKEISTVDLNLLKKELSDNPSRKADFQGRCRLHQAMRLALSPAQSRGSTTETMWSSSTMARRSRSRNTGSDSRKEFSEMAEVSGVSHFPRWLLGTGLAACLAVGAVVLIPVFTDSSLVSLSSVGVGEDQLDVDPISEVERSDLRRYALIREQQEQHAARSASLAAQLRLLGLRPEMLPEERQLSEVSLASLQRRDQRQREIERFNQLQDLSPIPQPQLLKTYESYGSSNSGAGGTSWPGGFQTSLTSFK